MIRSTSAKLSQLPIMDKPGVRQAKAAARAVREANARRTWADRVLPDIIVAGAQRTGTTSITEALYRLPMVDRPRRGKGSHYFSYNYSRGWPWFQSQFARQATAAQIEQLHGRPLVTFDACPYYLFHPFALARMAHHLPDVKVLVMLRDPVRRAESHYHHSVSHGHEDLDFAAALEAEQARLDGEVERMADDPSYWSHAHEHHSYVSKGLYVDQLERLFSLYPRDQVRVVQSEAFYREPDRHLGEITDWLGLPTVALSARDDRNAHRYDPMPDAVRASLIDTYSEPNEMLFELLGVRYDWQGKASASATS